MTGVAGSSLADRLAAAFARGHSEACEEPDEEHPGHCICDQSTLAVELAVELAAELGREDA